MPALDKRLLVEQELQERERDEDERAEEEVDEERGFELRRRFIERLVGTSDEARLERLLERARKQRAEMYELERSEFDPGERMRAQVTVADGRKHAIQADQVKSPTDVQGFGGCDRFVRVRARQTFPPTTLRFKLDRDALERVEPATLLVARWDEIDERFHLIPQSGYNEEFGYAFARISRSGVYTALGLPRDPRALSTLQVMRALKGWSGTNGEIDLIPKICQLILCNGAVEELAGGDGDRSGLAELGLEKADFTLGFGGNVCEMCLGTGRLDHVIEIDILDLLEVPPYELRPWPLPPKWPRLCPGWRNIGPENVPGRINAMAIHPTDGRTVYAGAAEGGVFKTTNSGTAWYPRWSEQLSLAVGGLAVSASSPDIIYAATGEWEGNVGAANNHFSGVGVYRSSDGGNDWDLLAPIPSRNTAAVAIDPTNPDRVFIAGDASLHRTTNGGVTWDVTPGNISGIFDGVISDVVIDPANMNTIYIGVHLSGVWLSTNGGASFTQLTLAANGIATGAAASAPKIALGRNGVSGSSFVAVKMAQRVFTATNGGSTAIQFTEQAQCDVNWAPFYPWANVIAVDPTNESILFGGHASIYRSTDGGATWTQVGGYGVPPVHPDQQALVFDPNDHDHLYLATDGGVYESTNNGQTWAAKGSGLVTTQCWTVGISQAPTLAYGITTQDNACYEWASGNSFSQILGPEGGWIEYDPKDANKLYADPWFTGLQRSTDGGTTWTGLGIDTDNGNSEALGIAWNNTDWLLAAQTNGVLLRSTTGGTGANPWTNVLSPAAGITAAAFAPSDDDHAYAGSNNGRVWHSTDGGATWTQLAGGLPAARIHDIEVDWSDPLRIYVGFGGLGIRHLWRGDIGAGGVVTWLDISGRLPALSLPDLALTGLALHPDHDETLYVSNILGVYRSVDGGESWAPFDEELPNAFVSDLDIRRFDRSLYASTMGRGLFRRFV
jgi:photosystem II stability/assembly factor-like uncharacterized protein